MYDLLDSLTHAIDEW